MDKNDQSFLLGVYASSIKPGPMSKREKSNLKCVAVILGIVLFFNVLLAIIVSTL